MNSSVNEIANAVLYEGYILYPYRPSSKMNRGERFAFGRVYPKNYSDLQGGSETCQHQTECLVQSRGKSLEIEVTMRFLQPLWREAGYITEGKDGPFRVVPELSVNGVRYQTWQEAIEREVKVSVGPWEPSQSRHVCFPFLFNESCAVETLDVGSAGDGAAIRRRRESLLGVVEFEAVQLAAEIFKITVRVSNRTALSSLECDDQDAVITRTFASTHTILRATGGEFISLLEPPSEFRQFAGQCKNIGTWPVLVGDERQAQRDTMLSSPIFFYDYPRIAPESEGRSFDGIEELVPHEEVSV